MSMWRKKPLEESGNEWWSLMYQAGFIWGKIWEEFWRRTSNRHRLKEGKKPNCIEKGVTQAMC